MANSDPTPTIEEFRLRVRRWLESHAAPRPATRSKPTWGEGSDSVALFFNLSFEEERDLIAAARQWQRKKSDAGLGSITWPIEFGGLGLPAAYERVFRSEERRFVTPVAHEVIGISTGLIAATIREHGTEEQKAKFVEALRRTDWVACQMFSEPGAGSDLASLSTRAETTGDCWLLSGQKVWTSGARFADWGLVLARTQAASDRHSGITAFLVALDSPGVDIRPLRQMTGGSSFNEVFLDDVAVPDSHRLGEVGDGWRVALTTLGFERAGSTSAEPIGATWEDVLSLTRFLERGDDAVTRQLLAQLYSAVQVTRWSAKRAQARSRAGHRPGPEGSLGKLAWTQQHALISEIVSHLLGPRLLATTGEWGPFSWCEHVIGAAGFRIAGGTDEIQRNIIAERVLGLPKDAS
jgi:alkylation response protein AidB-like acyl-CoA dehydrogenase